MLGLVVLRLVLGLIFLTHGYLKLFSPGFGPRRFAAYLRNEGMPFPMVTGYAIGVLELVAGLLITVGIGVHVCATLLALHVFVALVTVGPKKGFTRLPDNAGFEYELVLLAGLIALIFAAPTEYSLGAFIFR
jgi:putative oxidoreductase